MDKIQIQYSRDTIHTYIPVADPDLELRKGKGEAGPGFFACPAGISSCYFFFTQNKGGRAPRAPSIRYGTACTLYCNSLQGFFSYKTTQLSYKNN